MVTEGLKALATLGQPAHVNGSPPWTGLGRDFARFSRRDFLGVKSGADGLKVHSGLGIRMPYR